MREIKFRFWVKSEKRMEPACSMWWNYIEYLNEDDCIVMQFTGLKDKNGNEIYEGDILANGKGHKPCLVSFERDQFVVGEYGCSLWIYAGNNKEVIGNVWENPELLK